MSNQTIHELTNLSEISTNDELPIWDNSAGATKKVSVEELSLAVNNTANSYSTEEVNTGKKWIDGKPIYRKTISIGNLPNNNNKSFSLGIKIASLVNVQGYAHRALDGLIIPIPYTNPSLLNQNVAVTFPLVNDVSNIQVRTATDLSVYETCYVTIEYTKTTD